MYFDPYIDATGLHVPTYTDVRDYLIEQARAIYGNDIYLGSDSQDYQYISAVAYMINSSYFIAQEAYNNRSPLAAIGVGLDGIVKLNGIKRDAPEYSTCPVNLVGTPGFEVTQGIIANAATGIRWSLPSSVIFDEGGNAAVIATCQIEGPITAQAGELSVIITPTFGWTSVTNAVAALIGSLKETDAALRARQAISTSLPSRSILESLKGALLALSGVQRVEKYENDTDAINADGVPAHSICIVIEGGVDEEVAQAMFYKKGPGVGTYGDVSISVIDEYSNISIIKFFRPTYIDIDCVVNVKALSGYTSSTTDAIKAALVEYLDSLKIGEDLAISSLWGASLSAMPSLQSPIFSITSLTAAKHEGVQGVIDIPILFKEVTRGTLAYITINMV
jgi:uncharacterized phage protein gp47/JayE